ncbi:uncharacterized protein LOC119685475 [Teleopsis dalmanni]|uniref:uncharacterized protein LOC119685475 n=1 Tax=Teleopsis dalmanni TaxID=139649 RepID=UPI0018CD60F0|nr:uncharacterized protein LOC119685475 [Teleopsis dalmanni]
MLRTVNFLLWCMFLHIVCWGKSNWNYEPLSVDFITSNPDKLDSKGTAVRISRGKYALNGFIDIKEDVTSDWIVELFVLKSVAGNNNYIPTPFKMPASKFDDFMTNVYKRYLMESVQKCVPNAPVFKTSFVPPLKKQKFQINKCEIATNNFPHLEPGLYKLVFRVIKPYDMKWEINVKILAVN